MAASSTRPKGGTARKGRSSTTRKANRGTLRNPARGVVDLRHGNSPRPNARNPFYATWYDAVNKRKGGSKAFATLPEATQWRDAMEADNLAAYHRGEPTRSKSRAFGDVATEWTKTLTLTRNTIKGYRGQVRELIKHFGHDTPVGSIEKHDVKAMLHQVQKVQNLGNGTAKARLNVLNQVMDSALDRKLRADNPCRGVLRPKERQREAYIFTAAEVAAVLEHLPSYLALPVLLSYHGGLRIGEVCGLRARQLDLVGGQVKIVRVRHNDNTEQEHAKGGKVGEWADLPDVVLPELRRHAQEHPPLADGNLFYYVGRDGAVKPLSQDHLRRAFMKACAKAKLPVEEIRFHDLRHTCATNYARANAPAYVIQAQLRHARLDTSQRYISKVQDEQRRNWANIVGGSQAAPDDSDQPPAAA